jgi:hypothetical protein
MALVIDVVVSDTADGVRRIETVPIGRHEATGIDGHLRELEGSGLVVWSWGWHKGNGNERAMREVLR